MELLPLPPEDPEKEVHAKIREICLGNQDAINFLVAFFDWVHWLDDVCDKETEELTAKSIAEVNLTFLIAVSTNPFWLANSHRLLPIIIQATIAWVDSEKWKTQEGKNKVAADVLKGYYHEVFWHAAFILGGWEHALAVTQRHRAYDYEQ